MTRLARLDLALILVPAAIVGIFILDMAGGLAEGAVIGALIGVAVAAFALDRWVG